MMEKTAEVTVSYFIERKVGELLFHIVIAQMTK